MGKIILLLFFSFSITFSQIQGISEAEWFAGFDPGEGNGEPLLIDSGASTVKIFNTTLPKGKGTLTLPKLKIGSPPIYIRVKSTGFRKQDGTWVPGKWSFPVKVEFPTNQTIKNATLYISRKGKLNLWTKSLQPSDGKYDNVVENLFTIFPCDSLKINDTLLVSIQGHSDLWGGDFRRNGGNFVFPIVKEHLKLCTPEDLTISKIETSPTVKVTLTWKYRCSGATGFKIERRDFPNPKWNEIYITSKNDTSFVDESCIPMEKYSWRVIAINTNAPCDFTSDPSNEVTARIVSVDEYEISKPKESLKILYDMDKAEVIFSLSTSGKVSLDIYNVLGQKLVNLIDNKFYEQGEHIIYTDLKNLLSGIYYFVLQTPNNLFVSKIHIVK